MAWSQTDAVEIRFDWPVGLSADVHLSRVFAGGTPAGADTTGMLVSYSLTVHEHPGGRLIALDDFRLQQAMPPLEEMGSIEFLTGVVVPSFVVDASGRVSAVAELERLRATVQGQAMHALGLKEVPRGLASLVERITQPQDLYAVAADLWAAMIEAWNGATFTVGAVYESEGEEPSRMDPAAVVPVRYRFGVVDRVPCHPDDPETECVELRLVSNPTAPRTELSAAWALELFPHERGLTVESVEVEDTVKVIAEVDGLFPHLVEITRQTQGTATQGGGSFPFQRSHIRRIEIVYRGRP